MTYLEDVARQGISRPVDRRRWPGDPLRGGRRCMDVMRTRTSGASGAARPGGSVPQLSSRLRLTLFVRNTIFRLAVVAMLVGCFALVRHAKALFWPTGGHPPHNPLDHLV